MEDSLITQCKALSSNSRDDLHYFVFAAPHPDNEMVLMRFHIGIPKYSIDHVPDGDLINVDFTDLWPAGTMQAPSIN